MAKFKSGPLYLTAGVNNLVADDKEFSKFVLNSLSKHFNGDWGDLCEEDKKLNDDAVKNNNDRIFSAYNYNDDTRIYIITEWDRSATTVLFPSEY